jgi:hypothetical protein
MPVRTDRTAVSGGLEHFAKSASKKDYGLDVPHEVNPRFANRRDGGDAGVDVIPHQGEVLEFPSLEMPPRTQPQFDAILPSSSMLIFGDVIQEIPKILDSIFEPWGFFFFSIQRKLPVFVLEEDVKR